MINKQWTLGLILLFAGIIGLTLYFFQPKIYNVDDAFALSKRYLMSFNNNDLVIGEIMEFEQNFYVIYYEESTGLGAFEMLIDKSSGRIFPEYGPNMMWNKKYGHGGMMGGWSQTPSGQMPIDRDEAISIAQEFLDNSYPGTIAKDLHPFYGYYTIHVVKDGEVYGMLSVNGFDGVIWCHNWHGLYLQSRSFHDE
ncbi:MAG: hypothetical protein JSV51_05705 [Candidatus Bathyarchaeota archaeon]|nr:MAG: hypothetical protein JSV51_05705 [Candidatus Bathyarchaeota archaeon]